MSYNFRILRDWNIKEGVEDGGYRGQCCVNVKDKSADIYKWEEESEEPSDYLVHEYLHIALRALIDMDRRKPKELRQAEEELVRDICEIIENAKGKSPNNPPLDKNDDLKDT